MPKSTESLNRSLFNLLRTKGYNPTMINTSGKEIPVPEEADVFQFDFVKDGTQYGKVTISIDGLKKLTIYFNDDVANSEKGNDDSSQGTDWYTLLKQLKKFATHRQLSFELKNSSHLKHDMAKREYMNNKEKIKEGYYPMGKKASYSDAIPSVKIVIEHSRQLEEGEARFRSINRIFLENQSGERYLLNTKKPGVARVYARHIAEGGKVNDQRWDHVGSLVEEYSKMSGFVRATKNGQFNESAQQLVNEGLQHYQSLRETLSRMTGHRGYNSYFESWSPSLMEDESDTSNINELFVQETLDPRIESVMPILSKLHKKVSEMKEVNDLSDWADSLLEGESEELKEFAPVLAAVGGALVRSAAVDAVTDAFSDDDEVEEGLGDVGSMAKKAGRAVGGVADTIIRGAKKALDVIAPDDDELISQLRKSAGINTPHNKPSMAKSNDDKNVEESALQAYIGDKKGVEEDQINEAYIYTTADAVNVLANLRKISKNIEIGNPYKGNLANEYVDDVWSVYTWLENTDANMYDPKLKPILADVFELRKKAKALETQLNSGQNTQLANQIVNTLYPLMQWIEMNVKLGRQDRSQGVAEALANHGTIKKIQIRSRFDNSVLYSHTSMNNTVARTVLAAIDDTVALASANLRGADLRGIDLRLGEFQGADLRDADLRGTDLRGTDLRDADTRGANVLGAKLDKEQDVAGIYDRDQGMREGMDENFINTDAQAVVTEEEDRPYVCVHVKKGKYEVKASSSYQAAQKAAQKWGLKNTSGIDVHLADVKKDTSALEEGQDDLAAMLRIINR